MDAVWPAPLHRGCVLSDEIGLPVAGNLNFQPDEILVGYGNRQADSWEESSEERDLRPDYFSWQMCSVAGVGEGLDEIVKNLA